MNEPTLTDIRKIIHQAFPHNIVLSFKRASLGNLNWVYIIDLEQLPYKAVAKVVYRPERDQRQVMAKEVDLIKRLNQKNVIGVPSLIAYDNSKQVVPWTYLVESFIDGTPIIEQADLTETELRPVVKDIAKFISQIQTIKEPEITEFEKGASEYYSLADYVQDKAPEYLKLCQKTDKIPVQLVQDGYQLIIEGAKTINDKEFVLCHSDVSSHNVLIKNNKLAGIVDYEAVQTFTPEFDLVTAYHEFLNKYPTCWQLLLEDYIKQNSVPDNFPERMNIIMAYRALRYLSRVVKYDLWDYLEGDIARMQEVVDGTFIKSIKT